MSELDDLLAAYGRHVRIPWDTGLAGPQKVWFAIYDPAQERRLRLRLDEFRQRTAEAGRGWRPVDVTDAFGRWMAGQEYREEYFAEPEYLADLMPTFSAFVAEEVRNAMHEDGANETVVAVLGVGALFGLVRVSTLMELVAPAIRGRLLVFFPGSYDGSNYRLLDARDGWNYLAVPITAAART